MALERTAIQVLLGSEPLTDADVVINTLVGEVKKTDTDGKVVFGLESGYVGFTNILVKKAPNIRITAVVELEAGKTHYIEIPV